MKILQLLRALILAFVFSYGGSQCEGDEKISTIDSVLSATTISGYVDTSAQWNLNTNVNTNAAMHGFTGTWIGIVTDRTSTNRIEIYVLVDEAGNLAGRGMNFDRTLGSDQIDGTLDSRGKARIGQTSFYFRRNGIATVIGKKESGRFFSAQLFRERIR